MADLILDDLTRCPSCGQHPKLRVDCETCVGCDCHTESARGSGEEAHLEACEGWEGWCDEAKEVTRD